MQNEPRRGLLGVTESEYEEVDLSDDLAWLKLRLGKFVKGGTYLVAGQPGIGKSTLGIQLALDLGRRGARTVYILTEQSSEDLARRAKLMSSAWRKEDAERARASIDAEESVYDVEALPSFLAHQVLSPAGRYNGVSFIVVDSVQGHGLAAAATSKYKQVYEFCRQCKSAGITVLLGACRRTQIL